jgi:hypothetical protein
VYVSIDRKNEHRILTGLDGILAKMGCIEALRLTTIMMRQSYVLAIPFIIHVARIKVQREKGIMAQVLQVGIQPKINQNARRPT